MAYRVMMALSLLCPPLALLVRLSTFRRAFPALETVRRHKLYLAACVVGVFWGLAIIVAAVVVAVPGPRGGAGA
jgi:hypothetical protein